MVSVKDVLEEQKRIELKIEEHEKEIDRYHQARNKHEKQIEFLLETKADKTLIPLRELTQQLHEIESQVERKLNEVQSFLRDVKDDSPVTLGAIITHLYWEVPNVSVEWIEWIAKFLGIKSHRFMSYVEPKEIGIQCDKCGRSLLIGTHNDLDDLESKREALTEILCDVCNRSRESSTENKQTNGQIPYEDYLKTEHWKEQRKKALERADFRCQLCGTKNVEFHTHHNNYERLGEELPSDLIVLCADCHQKHHEGQGEI